MPACALIVMRAACVRVCNWSGQSAGSFVCPCGSRPSQSAGVLFAAAAAVPALFLLGPVALCEALCATWAQGKDSLAVPSKDDEDARAVRFHWRKP